MKTLFFFYKNNGWPAFVVTCITAFVLWKSGSPYVVIYLFWIKIIASLAVVLYFHLFRAKELYLYNNLGFSAIRLYSGAFLLDFGLWVCVMTTILQLR